MPPALPFARPHNRKKETVLEAILLIIALVILFFLYVTRKVNQ